MAKRGKYGKWSETDMHLAISAFKNGDMGLNQCAKIYGVPKATLKRHLDGKNTYANEEHKFFGKGTTFSPEMETELASHILKFEECMFGLTIKDVRELAFEFADKNDIAHSFDKEKRMAGKKWFYSFMRRHPTLSLRQPESTSLARAKGFNRESVKEFFKLLKETVDKNNISASRIYNVDESGYTTVQKKVQRVIAMKGKRQIGGVTSGERGINTTVVCCTSAAGHYIPPMYIFKRKRFCPELEANKPAGGIVAISDTGYINSELFLVWLKHFRNIVNASENNKILLLLDGHSTHSKNLAALDFACENHIVLLQLPGHTTHRLQPLDVAFFKPLRTFYEQLQDSWLRSHPGEGITVYRVPELLNEAYGRAATIHTAVNAFRASGIWPVNEMVFKDHHFAAADALVNRATEEEEEEKGNKESNDSVNSDISKTDEEKQEIKIKNLKHSLAEISPLPQKRCVTMYKGSQKAAILTSTSYKNDLEDKQKKRRQSMKRKLSIAPQKQKKQRLEVSEASTSANTSDDWFCYMCKKSEEQSTTQCSSCMISVQDTCAKIKHNQKYFTCERCK